MSNPVEAITAEMVAMTDEVEAVKRLAGHGDCNGWGTGGEPYGARCGCGMPFDELVTLARVSMPASTVVTYEIVDEA
jgi:hypothetical protein